MAHPASLSPAARSVLAHVLISGYAPGGTESKTTNGMYYNADGRPDGFLIYATNTLHMWAVPAERMDAALAAVAEDPTWKMHIALLAAGFKWSGWERGGKKRRKYMAYVRYDESGDPWECCVRRGSAWFNRMSNRWKTTYVARVGRGASVAIPADVGFYSAVAA